MLRYKFGNVETKNKVWLLLRDWGISLAVLTEHNGNSQSLEKLYFLLNM